MFWHLINYTQTEYFIICHKEWRLLNPGLTLSKMGSFMSGKAAVLSPLASGVWVCEWLYVPICSVVPFRCFWSWFYFNCLALSVGYLCRYRTTEVISHYAIWCRHNYKITVCNLFILRQAYDKNSQQLLSLLLFIFHSQGWVGGSRKWVRGCVCLAGVGCGHTEVGAVLCRCVTRSGQVQPCHTCTPKSCHTCTLQCDLSQIWHTFPHLSLNADLASRIPYSSFVTAFRFW